MRLHMPHLQSCKVDDRVDIRVLFEYCVECFFVSNVDLFKCWSFPANELNTVDYFARRVVEVVDNNNFVAGLKQ